MDYLLVGIVAFGAVFLGVVIGARIRNRSKK
ncbi:MAG: hypothetical protein FD164_1653 [Nitrospirae bacterium]|nr:MAG: hypothetical protein FD164_1653 [Nitrospirota bacterium]